MGLVALGINHKSATVSLRERVAFAPEQMVEALNDAIDVDYINEVVILSTCNRTELFAMVEDEDGNIEQLDKRLLQWLGAYHHISLSDLNTHTYCYHDREALKHMIQVASGLDSMVLGEPQIFGQFKSAFNEAKDAQAVGAEFRRIFPHVFSIAKKVRTDTGIGENPVSIAYAAVNLSQHIFSNLADSRTLLIGAGETIELVARHLSESGVREMIVANRTIGRARDLAQQFGAEAILLSEIPSQLHNADIVISSTASQLPILGKGAVEKALKQRKHKPMLLVDIAVPRDIEEQVGELDDVYLYSVDDLTEIIDENRRSREVEAEKAAGIIELGIDEYFQQLRVLDGVTTLKAFRTHAETTRDVELDKSLKALAKGEDPELALRQLARSLTNTLIHNPSMEIKKASAEGKAHLVAWVHELFSLPEQEEEDNNEQFTAEDNSGDSSELGSEEKPDYSQQQEPQRRDNHSR